MPVPQHLRPLIGYATRYLPGPLSISQIRERVALQFPTRSPAEHAEAVRLALEFRQAGRRSSEVLAIQRGYTAEQYREAGMDSSEARRLSGRTTRIPPATSLLDTMGMKQLGSGQISARVYVVGELLNGERIQLSLVFQFDDSATLNMVTNRIVGYLLSGSILNTRYKYAFRKIAIDFLNVVPYGRANTIPLDVAPITRHHPNPYPIAP